MRWVVESDTAEGLLTWPEEFDDLANALSRDLRIDRPNCRVDATSGAISVRFVLDAESRDGAEVAAREALVDALDRARFRIPAEPLEYVAVTPTTRA